MSEQKPLGAGKPANAHDPYGGHAPDNQEGLAPEADGGDTVYHGTGKGGEGHGKTSQHGLA